MGRAYGLLAWYRYTGETRWLERAEILAQRAGVALAEPRNAEARPLSLYQGKTGWLLLLADLQRPETAAFPLFEPESWPG